VIIELVLKKKQFSEKFLSKIRRKLGTEDDA
jgi:hypothetical protein